MTTLTLYACANDLPFSTERLKAIGGGTCLIEFHVNLPPITSDRKGIRYIYWCGVETGQHLYGVNGTGDDQIWVLYPYADKYVPLKITIARNIP